ncbi:MFS transporter [Sphingomonas panacisoli]|uniref:MFS transporter n=1 Tax=Sphingomonas panacisoli TaxID=1813879 RepID=A0A5B8LHS6_9SPHN|nr:MFS transporter [Sphingomonas panacisoli]QDZ07857.1 MFS transporter [Sphingomonas panacisoli]
MDRRHLPIVGAITLTFFLFAILMNSVGAVILQSVLTFQVPKTQAALLEGCKDLSAAAASFVVVLLLARLGYRRGTALGLLAVAAACFAVPLAPAFWLLELQFVVVGAAFAIAKTSVYVIVGLITESRKQHASMTSALEGMFMIGVLSSYWLFSAFIDSADPARPTWLGVYWVLGIASLLVAAAIAFAPLDERLAENDTQSLGEQWLAMPRLLARPFVVAFIVCAFIDVLVEQSIGSWLPTFNREVMNLPAALAVQLASLWATGLAVGRLGAGLVLRRVPWVWTTGVGMTLSVVILAVVVPLTQPSAAGLRAGWFDLPPAAFAVPVVGLLLAPIYPALCSSVLSGLPQNRHAAMTGLILISSALGGTIGSFITGHIFAALSGKAAFLAILPPLALLLVATIVFERMLRRTPLASIEPLSPDLVA